MDGFVFTGWRFLTEDDAILLGLPTRSTIIATGSVDGEKMVARFPVSESLINDTFFEDFIKKVTEYAAEDLLNARTINRQSLP